MTADRQRALYVLALYDDLFTACRDGRIHPAEAWRYYLAGNFSQTLYACETVLRQEGQLWQIAQGWREAHYHGGMLLQELALRGVARWWEQRQAMETREREMEEAA